MSPVCDREKANPVKARGGWGWGWGCCCKGGGAELCGMGLGWALWLKGLSSTCCCVSVLSLPKLPQPPSTCSPVHSDAQQK